MKGDLNIDHDSLNKKFRCFSSLDKDILPLDLRVNILYLDILEIRCQKILLSSLLLNNQ